MVHKLYPDKDVFKKAREIKIPSNHGIYQLELQPSLNVFPKARWSKGKKRSMALLLKRFPERTTKCPCTSHYPELVHALTQ